MSKLIFSKKIIGDRIDKISKPKRLLYFLIAISVLLFIIFLFLFTKSGSDEKSIDKNIIQEEGVLAEEPCLGCFYRLIDGREVVRESDASPFLTAVIVDNHPDARPSFGLSSAELVYDIPAEGGINRYLAFFVVDNKDGLEVGPVRSVRPYFLDIAKEYGAIIAHCGGSPEALARVSKEKLLSFNEFYNGSYFRRYKSYLAPHNILLNLDLFRDYLRDRNYESSKFEPWIFKKNNTPPEIDLFLSTFEVSVLNGQKQYASRWEYDLDLNLYFKYLADKKHIDSNGEQISAVNLIFHFVETKILDSELRLKIDLLGGNRAVVCLDGLCNDGYWQKEDEGSRTRYYKESGEEFVFNIGKTWVHFIDENTNLGY